MKTFAQIQDNIIVNLAKFDDVAELENGCIDVTGVRCNIGDPVVGGVAVPQPSRWHTLNGVTWSITAENQVLKDAHTTEQIRRQEVVNEIDDAGIRNITVAQAHDKIDQIFASATTIATLREATKVALKKIIPFII